MIVIKRSVSRHLLSGLLETSNAKELFDAIGQGYLVFGIAKSGCLMKELIIIKYDIIEDVREYILKIIHLPTKLKSLKIDLSDSFLVSHALNSLSIEFFQIKIAYRTLNEI